MTGTYRRSRLFWLSDSPATHLISDNWIVKMYDWIKTHCMQNMHMVC